MKLNLMNRHSYLVYVGSPGPGTVRSFGMSVTPNHIHFLWGNAIDIAYDVILSTKVPTE